ncbi:hypothetical protein AWB80_01163 [Caballeronia pedi]|uniref:Uncharacterized protein n=1 Tax=Caballeronia pedi TaxID=1777141 RepID=A0A157ZR18_9BURK|nr:hypothetical protein AWB80_01163 [Caballeronia pedi]
MFPCRRLSATGILVIHLLMNVMARKVETLRTVGGP